MKKFALALGLTFILLGWGWPGYYQSGTAPAFGQPYPPPPPPGYCDPNYYNCTYDNYYSAPYANPLDQFFYYTIPQIGGEIIRAARAPRVPGTQSATSTGGMKAGMKAGMSGIKAGVA